KDDPASILGEQLRLICGQGRPEWSDYVVDPVRSEGNVIHIPLYDERRLLLSDRPTAPAQPVEDVALVIDRALGRVEVFRDMGFDRGDDPAAESDDATGEAFDRKDDAATEGVVRLATTAGRWLQEP